MDSSLIVPLGFSLREYSPWDALGNWSSLMPGHHKNHLIWMDSSLMALFEQFKTLVQYQGLASPAWSSREPPNLRGLDQGDPLGFVQCVPWAPSKSSLPPGCIHYSSFNKVTVHHPCCPCCVSTLCIFAWAFMLFDSKILLLFGYVVQLCHNLLLPIICVLCLILILEIDPVHQ